MKKKEFVDAFESINIDSNMERRIIDNCQRKSYNSKFIIVSRKKFVMGIILGVISLSVTACAIVGKIIVKLPAANFAKNTDYVMELQKDEVRLDEKNMQEINQLYIELKQNKESIKVFDSFSEAGKFLGIDLLDNELFQHNKGSISLEVYGDRSRPNRIKLVSYQNIMDEQRLSPVIAEFAINKSGNFSQIIASSSGTNKKTIFKSYHSKKNDITAEIIVIEDSDSKSYDMEVYFIEKDVLYNFYLPCENKLLISTVIKRAEDIVDKFTF